MNKILLFFFLSFTLLLNAQEEHDAFDKYGPPGMVYTNLKDALVDVNIAYKVKIEDQVIDPKLLPKLGKLSQVQALQLTSNGLTQLPAEFKDLTNLLYFACIGNAITSLPKDFRNLENLTELHLHSTKLDSLPWDIAYLGRLKVLEMQNNSAGTFYFPNSIGYLSHLNTMLLFNTKLDTLPASFGEFKRLKNLTFVMCGITKIPKTIGNISSLEQLVLDNNQIT
jgi:Leucine-rich repeat (LRR) protein